VYEVTALGPRAAMGGQMCLHVPWAQVVPVCKRAHWHLSLSIDRTARINTSSLVSSMRVMALRVSLNLLAANRNAGFTSFTYNVTQPFVTPVQGVLPNAQSTGSDLEYSAMLVLLVYALLAFGIVRRSASPSSFPLGPKVTEKGCRSRLP
jgi:YGGT family